MARMFTKLAAALTGATIIACGDASPDPLSPRVDESDLRLSAASTQGSVLATVRAATAKYRQVDAAIADGYIRISACVADEGIHYLKPALVNGVLDPAQPEHLLYEELPNGKLRLAGVEYVIVSAAWDRNNSTAPLLGDQPFLDRRVPPFGAPFPNYALFVWVWTHNPNGMYTQLNPQVSCG